MEQWYEIYNFVCNHEFPNIQPPKDYDIYKSSQLCLFNLNEDIISQITSYLTKTEKYIFNMACDPEMRDITLQEIQDAIECEQEARQEELDMKRYLWEEDIDKYGYGDDFDLYEDW